MDLVAAEELKRLKYRYLRAVDLKDWEQLAATLLPEVTANYGSELAFGNRDELVGYLRKSLSNSIITEHHCGHPELEIDGDAATGTWYLQDLVIIPEQRMMLRGAAFYSDRYLRDGDGQWLIQHTGYERTYAAMLSLDDVPSFTLTENRWTH